MTLARDDPRHSRGLAQVAAPVASPSQAQAEAAGATYPASFIPPPPYNVSLPPFPVNYTADAMIAQRNAGTLLQANIDAAVNSGSNS